MDPLSRRTRIIYLLSFIILFIVTIPVAILYANGYRLSNLSLVPTGGVYVTVPQSDAIVSINGKAEGTSNIFTRGFYVSNLSPGSYSVHVEHPSTYPWYRTLIVEPGIVTDVRALLAPQQITPIKLIRSVVASSTSTTTRAVARAQYDAYLALFITATSTPGTVLVNGKLMATSSDGVFGPVPQDQQSGAQLIIDDGHLRLHWARATSSIPSSFCAQPSVCVDNIFIKMGKDKIITARFWEGGIVYTAANSGVYLSEADVRPSPLLVPIYSKAGADFRISNNSLIIKDGTSLYQIDPF